MLACGVEVFATRDEEVLISLGATKGIGF